MVRNRGLRDLPSRRHWDNLFCLPLPRCRHLEGRSCLNRILHHVHMVSLTCRVCFNIVTYEVSINNCFINLYTSMYGAKYWVCLPTALIHTIFPFLPGFTCTSWLLLGSKLHSPNWATSQGSVWLRNKYGILSAQEITRMLKFLVQGVGGSLP